MGKKVAIVTLDFSPDLFGSSTLLGQLALIWQQQGFEVEVTQGISEEVTADIVISHIDLTLVPDEYTTFLKKYPVVINGVATDISKTRISQNLLSMRDTYEGPVIVKTAANYGGIPELIRQESLGQTAMGFERPWRKVEWLDPHHYPLFDSVRHVPHGVWKNKNLVVEKFLAERNEDGHYRLRSWFFLGDKELGKSEYSNNPIVKTGTFKKEIIANVPAELRTERIRLGIDFGRIDYAVINGKAVIYDINTTPVIHKNTLALFGDRLEELAAGINHFIKH